MMITRRLMGGLSMMITVCFAGPLLGSDTVLLHGHIYTANPKTPWAEALAITGARIDAVGTDQEISRRRTAKTKVIDLEGRMVIPGIVDTHTHMWFGALALHGFNLSTPEFNITPDNPEAFVDTIKIYAASHPNDKVLYGRGRFRLTVTHDVLDSAVSDRPVVMHATSEHMMFVNGQALALAGITDEPLADPAVEKLIVRDSRGHPTGVVREGAMQLVAKSMPPMPREEQLALLRDASHYLNRYGITSVANATGDLEEIRLYAALRDRGELTVRTRTAFGSVSVNHHLTPQFLADLEQARTLFHDDWVSANLVKFFADGSDGFAYDPAEYRKLIVELDKRGFNLVTHAIASIPIHAVLDAYEDLEKSNGPRDRRLRMEHLFNIPPEDLPRFKQLSVTAGMQPSFCCGLNDPENTTHQWRSLEKNGAALTFSSDWPCTFPPDPMVAIQEAVTRETFPEGHIGVVTPTLFGLRPSAESDSTASRLTAHNANDERLTVEQALAAYMRGPFAISADDRLGTLEAGKYADLVVLSHDIFKARPQEIGATEVLMTMVGGKTVFTRLQGLELKIGTWKLNLQKSKFPPGTQPPRSDTRVYDDRGGGVISSTHTTMTAQGQEALTTYVAKVDGREHPVVTRGSSAQSSIEFQMIDQYSESFVLTRDGKVVTRGTTTISKDGKKLTMVLNNINSQGQTSQGISIYEKQ